MESSPEVSVSPTGSKELLPRVGGFSDEDVWLLVGPETIGTTPRLHPT